MKVRHLESTYLVSAIVEQKDVPELRTAAYSRQQLSVFLEDNPAAITLAQSGTGNSERLLGLFLLDSDLFKPLLETHRKSDPWLLFVEGTADQLLLKEIIQNEQVVNSVQTVAQHLAGQTIVMIRRSEAVRSRLDALLDALRRVIDSPSSRAAQEAARASVSDSESDRQQLLRIRKEMLDEAGGTFSSEDLATAANSTTTNSSQLAADQRGSGKLFGVRWGREWRYPTFQFDAARRLSAEMREVLTALSPDPNGWDRLQWFLQPHERLHGSTPLQVWKTDRRKVIEAANTERWNGRD
jgi:hypothetical protein